MFIFTVLFSSKCLNLIITSHRTEWTMNHWVMVWKAHYRKWTKREYIYTYRHCRFFFALIKFMPINNTVINGEWQKQKALVTCQQAGSWKEGIKARMKDCRQTKVANSWGGGAVWQTPGADLKVIFIISHIPPHSSTLWLYCRQGGTEGEAHRWGARGESLQLLRVGLKHGDSDKMIEKSLRGVKDIHSK